MCFTSCRPSTLSTYGNFAAMILRRYLSERIAFPDIQVPPRARRSFLCAIYNSNLACNTKNNVYAILTFVL